jgi:hypothetical protein
LTRAWQCHRLLLRTADGMLAKADMIPCLKHLIS